MCVLCSQLFSEIHWSERTLDAKSFTRGAEETERRQNRHARIRLLAKVLSHYGLEVTDDWSATNYVLDDRKGNRQIVANLADLWRVAGRMAGRPLDPLDPGLLDRLRSVTPDS